jgi:hypothetical protein
MLKDFFLDSGRWGVTSEIAASIFFALGLVEHSRDKAIPSFAFFTLCIPLFWIGAYLAWRKQYIANREGPDILMEWDSKDGQLWDMVRFRNIGRTSALRVELLDFSWTGFSWHRIVQFQSIHPGEAEVRAEAQFSVGNTIGYMHSDLPMNQEHRKIPLSVSLRFFDSNNTKFIRTFILHPKLAPSVGSDSYIIVEIGKLKITRP